MTQWDITKSINPQSSISAVCLKKKITGHGLKSVAYGYGWCFAEEAYHNRYIDGKFYKGTIKINLNLILILFFSLQN